MVCDHIREIARKGLWYISNLSYLLHPAYHAAYYGVADNIEPVLLAKPQWVNLSPAYLCNGLSVLTPKIPVEWKKSNFQNELTNKKFKLNSKSNSAYTHTVM